MAREPDTVVGERPPRGEMIEQLVGSIGPKVRELRRKHGLSLQQMAALTELSAASIHKVERGDMVPTITTLLKLASAFGEPLTYFVDEQAGGAPALHVTRAGERPPLPALGAGTERGAVTAGTPRFRLEGEVVRVEPGTSGEEGPTARPGEQLLVVLDGALEVASGPERVTVRKGDALHRLTDQALTWTNTGRRPASLLRVHVPHA